MLFLSFLPYQEFAVALVAHYIQLLIIWNWYNEMTIYPFLYTTIVTALPSRTGTFYGRPTLLFEKLHIHRLLGNFSKNRDGSFILTLSRICSSAGNSLHPTLNILELIQWNDNISVPEYETIISALPSRTGTFYGRPIVLFEQLPFIV